MQTFLPYPTFSESARCLDRQRLGKQRVEAFQLIRALTEPDYGWKNHPAAKMWRGNVPTLAVYGSVICVEWRNRGYKDTMFWRFQEFIEWEQVILPPWIGDPDFHASHRSNLLRKDPVHYGQFGWTEADDLPYVWPITQGDAA